MFAELLKEADAYGRLLANSQYYGDGEDTEVLDEEINKIAHENEYISDEEERLLGQVAARAFIDENEKIAFNLPAAAAGVAGLGLGLGVGVGGPALHRRVTEDRLVDKLKQANPTFRSAYPGLGERKQSLVRKALRNRWELARQAEGLI